MKLMSQAMDLIPNFNAGKAAFYMNRSVFTGMKNYALDKSQNALAIQTALDQFGNSKSWLSFLGIPLRKCDALLNTESLVS
jgi:hypothetical protein